MLPLMDILEENPHIKKLNLASSGMHDARCVIVLSVNIISYMLSRLLYALEVFDLLGTIESLHNTQLF